ncbi:MULTISPECIES: hypothetical protein [Marinobacter]|uniref:Uncharacterized protein n=1 Tax=Marinobacter xestospongiae TaxID=994319 RepID=A0ABU3VY04_9GAMM|nr:MULTISPECIES: hypothetical protein [Marinobacter]MCG8518877.1 hypothetical protein [Pseudomonadales bacterium]MCK7566038.1 hypothetical protein [Marinobacter xestospongiae]MDV2079177.1 hypothetical protein [Marinobacter xestospongiae]UDL06962.1 hypothetical protein J2887_09555 [Marinobacter sp. CA1]
MRKIALISLMTLMSIASLQANASLADRKSDEARTEAPQPSPYSGQVVHRGEVRTDKA